MRVICLDPSGNYHEGDGTTGVAYFDDGKLKSFGDVKATDHISQEEYWRAVWCAIENAQARAVVIESYRLFAHKAKQQSWSQMETPQLIGYLRMMCYEHQITVYFQDPNDKVRVADVQLEKMGVIEKRGNLYYCNGKKTNLHMRDAIRHGIFFHRYGKGKGYADNPAKV